MKTTLNHLVLIGSLLFSQLGISQTEEPTDPCLPIAFPPGTSLVLDETLVPTATGLTEQVCLDNLDDEVADAKTDWNDANCAGTCPEGKNCIFLSGAPLEFSTQPPPLPWNCHAEVWVGCCMD